MMCLCICPCNDHKYSIRYWKYKTMSEHESTVLLNESCWCRGVGIDGTEAMWWHDRWSMHTAEVSNSRYLNTWKMYRVALPVATADHADINNVTDNRHDRWDCRCKVLRTGTIDWSSRGLWTILLDVAMQLLIQLILTIPSSFERVLGYIIYSKFDKFRPTMLSRFYLVFVFYYFTIYASDIFKRVTYT